MFISALPSCPTVDPDDDATLWKQYAANPTPALRQTLLERSMPLLRQVARSMAAKLPTHIALDDLVSSGTFGLMAAASRFSAEREVRFSTYAKSRIQGAILDELRAQDWVPRSIRQKLRAVANAEGELSARLGRAPTEEELCESLGLPPVELHEISRARTQFQLRSLDETISEEDTGHCLLDTLRDASSSRDPERVVHELAVRQSIARAVCRLTERERLVLQLKYFEGLTCGETASVLGVSDSRVSQLHTRALERLREILAAEQRELCDSE